MVEFHGIVIPEDKLAEICRRYQVRELSLFGSILRDDFGEDSDIDVLVEFEAEARAGLFQFLELQYELADVLGHKVDLVPKDCLKPLIREPVLRRARTVYPAHAPLHPVCREAARCSDRQSIRSRREPLHLHTMIEACDSVSSFIEGHDYGSFAERDLTRSAVVSELTLIGHSASALPTGFRDRYPAVGWSCLISLSDDLIRRYYEVDWAVVWDTASLRVPLLRQQIATIIEVEFPGDPAQYLE